MPTERTLGDRLRDLRDDRGLTQAQLAAEIGVTQVAISGYETGLYVPKLLTLIRIAHALEVSLSDFAPIPEQVQAS